LLQGLREPGRLTKLLRYQRAFSITPNFLTA
jgi:hypothetical protein